MHEVTGIRAVVRHPIGLRRCGWCPACHVGCATGSRRNGARDPAVEEADFR